MDVTGACAEVAVFGLRRYLVHLGAICYRVVNPYNSPSIKSGSDMLRLRQPSATRATVECLAGRCGR